MPEILYWVIPVVVIVALALWLRSREIRLRVLDRILPEPTEEEIEEILEAPEPAARPAIQRFGPWVVGIVVALVFWQFSNVGLFFAIALALLAAVAFHLGAAFFLGRRGLKLETQLAESIDLMIGSLQAGAGVMDALQSAETAARRPLRPHLSVLLARIRYGDDPRIVCRDMAARLPLESFRLFYFALAVQWEGGGSLAATLATSARFIRDRVEVARRIRAQSAEARFSVIGVLGLTYFLALLMWHVNKERLEGFLSTKLGWTAVAAAIILQALGAFWINRISRIRF
ncbi:MAG: type II secretion system F family protein [Planctomycetota bacterium]|jgi:tight adherence protein B